NERRSVARRDDMLDQSVDRRVVDADQVAGAGLIWSSGGPKFSLLVAGGKRLRPYRHDDVVVTLPQAVFVLDGVDQACRNRDAQIAQSILVEQHRWDEGRI